MSGIKKWIIILLCLSLVIIVGYDMYNRSLNDLLWGYRPLALFLGGWVSLTLLFESLFSKVDHSKRWLAYAMLTGVLLGIGFPEIIPFPFLMFIGFVPLLFMESEIRNTTERSGRILFTYSYVAFVFWNIIATYWVANASLAAGLFAILVNSLLMCIPILLFHYTRKAMPSLWGLAFISFWLSFEYIHLNWDLSWPWLTLGNSFAEYPSLVQWYEYTGHLGGSAWVLLLNVWIYQLLSKEKERTTKTWLMPIFGLLLPIGLSLFQYYNYEEQGEPKEVAIVQPNYEPHYEKFSIPESDQLRQYLNLSRNIIKPNTSYLVYPEASFGYVETHQIETYPAVRALSDFLLSYPRLNLVLGMNAYTRFLPNEPSTINTRMNIGQNGDTVRYEMLNIATQISQSNEEFPIYKKSKLVPGPEIFPYQSVLSIFKPIVDQLGGTTAGIGTQAERSVFTSKSGKIAPVICYESVYGEYFTGYIRKGAQAAFIVTNDGWWDNTAGHRQHLMFASLRAIETRRSIARSAYTGVSAFINQRGDIVEQTKYNEAVAISRDVFFNDKITFFVRNGNMITRIALFLSLLFMANIVVKQWQSNRESNH